MANSKEHISITFKWKVIDTVFYIHPLRIHIYLIN